jgi:hypothetical protein
MWPEHDMPATFWEAPGDFGGGWFKAGQNIVFYAAYGVHFRTWALRPGC